MKFMCEQCVMPAHLNKIDMSMSMSAAAAAAAVDPQGPDETGQRGHKQERIL